MFEWIRRRGASGDVRTLKETAAREMAKGRWVKALAPLQALVEREPRELQHRIRLGDCLRHLDRGEEAASHWLHAASGWAAAERWERAIGACRLVLSVYENDPDVLRQLEALERRRRETKWVPARAEGPAEPHQDGWTPRQAVHAIELEGWSDDSREVSARRPRERTHPVGGESGPRLRERTPPPGYENGPPVMHAGAPPPEATGNEGTFGSAVEEEDADAMPESVFENLHASFSSALPGQAHAEPEVAPEAARAEAETTPAPRPLPPLCTCRKCPTCVRRRHLWRIVHTLDDEPVRKHLTE